MDNMGNKDELKRSSRRKFLKKTSAGAILASLPAASVWGQDSLIAGSIAASGQGSDFGGNSQMALLSPGYWKNHPEDWGSLNERDTYFDCTGKLPFGYGSSYSIMKDKQGNRLDESEMKSITLMQILQNPGGGNGNGNIKGKCGGPGNINCYIVEMMLNAANHGRMLKGQLINFPVLATTSRMAFSTSSTSNRALFADVNTFGNYLHTTADGRPTVMAAELEALLNGNHA